MTPNPLAGLRRDVLRANRAIRDELERRRPDLVKIAELRSRERSSTDRLARARALLRAAAPTPATAS